jgi:ABC-2 type transport system ATP-binding protein
MSKQQAVIQAHSLTKYFGESAAVYKLDLQIMPGEVFGFLGPNGAGKTTTIRMLMGEIMPTDGTVTIFGHDAIQDRAITHRDIGYLSGDMALEGDLTGQQYLAYIARLRGGVSGAAIKQLAHRFDCDLHIKIKRLSRGNRQKIALIAAVMHQPALLILDEPTSGFDPLIQAEFNKLVLECKKQGKTVFISSHILSEIQHLCDRVAFIRHGQLIQTGDMSSLTESTLKQIRVTFKDAKDVEHIRALHGTKAVVADDRHVVFDYGGHVQDLLGVLSHLHVVDVSITDADLEELFLRYYKGRR